jgi:hypothetical protein
LVAGGEINPGDVWFEKVYIVKYCRFENPGTYTVRVFHDLGFGERRVDDPREVSLTIKLIAPTEEQARAILDAADRAKPDQGGVWGRKGEAKLDYSALRYPTYLPALVDRAVGVNFQNAFDGIASIRTLEATRALVKLMGEGVMTRLAAAKLEPRLPHPQSDMRTNGFFWGPRRGQSVENTWDETFVPPVRDFALRLLANKNRSDFLLAASLLRCIGTPREMPAVLNALEYAVERTGGEFSEDVGYPRHISACDQLAEVAMRMEGSDWVFPQEVKTPGKALLFIACREEGERAAPKEYEATYAKLLRHPLVYVRAKALEGLATNVPPSHANLVTECMTDTNLVVQNFAFIAALGMNDPRHREIALAALKSSNDSWLRSSASTIALKCGARYDCALIWASHLDEPENAVGNNTFDVLSHLFSIVAGPYHSGSGGRVDDGHALRNRWESFLTTNKGRIENGHIFKLGIDMPGNLLPGGFSFD